MRFGWNNILLFLFSVLTALNLICGIWASSIILDRPLGSHGPGLHFELASGGPGMHNLFRLGEWADRRSMTYGKKGDRKSPEEIQDA